MTVTSYYRFALWIPVLFPAGVVVVGFLGNTFFGQETPFLQMAAVLSVPLPGYIPIAVWIRSKMKKGALSESDLSRIAKVTPPIVALIGAVVTLLFGSLIQGAVVIAALFLFFGYIYVAAIELGRAIGSRVGWLVPTSLERPSSGALTRHA
jgi:hypothetical protein